MRKIRFTFLCNEEERNLLQALANYYHRNQSDLVRWLIVKTAQNAEVAVKQTTPLTVHEGTAYEGQER